MFHAITPRSWPSHATASLVFVALVSGGCGSSHHSGPSDLAISDLQVFQNSTSHILALQATFVDHDGDLFNGTCNIATNLGAVSIPINKATPGIAPNAITGPISCFIQFKPGLTGAPLTGTMSVTDVGGHVSNALSFSTTIPEQTRGTRGSDSVASLSPESARMGR